MARNKHSRLTPAWPLFSRCVTLGLTLGLALSLGACRRSLSSNKSGSNGTLKPPPGGKAGEIDPAALGLVYDVTTKTPPAAIRPDPDLYVRRLLRQYRPENSVIARQIGKVEQFRLLLGGATEDFRTEPQETYDATSLLAMQKVAEEICTGLVAPTGYEHPGWNTILPHPTDQVNENLKFLAQRFLGLPTERISNEVLAALALLVDDAKENNQYTYDSYIPACVALSTDAEALLL